MWKEINGALPLNYFICSYPVGKTTAPTAFSYTDLQLGRQCHGSERWHADVTVRIGLPVEVEAIVCVRLRESLLLGLDDVADLLVHALQPKRTIRELVERASSRAKRVSFRWCQRPISFCREAVGGAPGSSYQVSQQGLRALWQCLPVL